MKGIRFVFLLSILWVLNCEGISDCPGEQSSTDGNCPLLKMCAIYDEQVVDEDRSRTVKFNDNCDTYVNCEFLSPRSSQLLDASLVQCQRCRPDEETCNVDRYIYRQPENIGYYRWKDDYDGRLCFNSNEFTPTEHPCGTKGIPPSTRTTTTRTTTTRTTTTTTMKPIGETTTPPFIPPVNAAGPMDY